MFAAHRLCRYFGVTSIFGVPPRSCASAVLTMAVFQRRGPTTFCIDSCANGQARRDESVCRPSRIVRAVVLALCQFSQHCCLAPPSPSSQLSSSGEGVRGGCPPPPRHSPFAHRVSCYVSRGRQTPSKLQSNPAINASMKIVVMLSLIGATDHEAVLGFCDVAASATVYLIWLL